MQFCSSALLFAQLLFAQAAWSRKTNAFKASFKFFVSEEPELRNIVEKKDEQAIGQAKTFLNLKQILKQIFLSMRQKSEKLKHNMTNAPEEMMENIICTSAKIMDINENNFW